MQFRNSVVQVSVEEARRLHLAGEFETARAVAQKLLSRRPDDLDALEVVALVEMEHGDLGRSLRLLRKIAKARPERPEAQYNLALAYRYSGRLTEAAAVFRQALELDPKLKPATDELSNTLANLGRFDELEAVCRSMIGDEPNNPHPYHQLAFAKPAAITDTDIAAMTRAAADDTLSPARRAGFLFAFAEVLRRRGAHDESFATLRQANETAAATLAGAKRPSKAIAPAAELIQRRGIEEAGEAHRVYCDYVTETFTADFFAAFGGHGDRSRVPIFIVGMPRSGSTLIEQILASHPKVFGAGEIPDLTLITQMKWPYGGPPTKDGKRPAAPPGAKERYFRDLGRSYVAQLKELDPDATRVVNKTLGNYVHVGMIELCLPNAVIIDARRNPIDNCLACYQRQFRSGNEFSYDLAALGAQYRRYDAVMRHWDKVLPGRVLRVDYEAMVTDPETQVRRLLAHCRLPWSDTVLRFYENDRPVRTASLSQVRQPIHTGSVEKWRLYERHLGPLIEALGDLVASDARN